MSVYVCVCVYVGGRWCRDGIIYIYTQVYASGGGPRSHGAYLDATRVADINTRLCVMLSLRGGGGRERIFLIDGGTIWFHLSRNSKNIRETQFFFCIFYATANKWNFRRKK